MITPINDYILIEPLEHDSFIASQKETYEEIGIVIDTPNALSPFDKIPKGTKIYFDAWLASKYPKEDGTFYWLVPFSSIKAYESPTA